MDVDEFPGLYLLGSLNRHITVYSQQCRAINLVRALMKEGNGLDEKSVAVVGAGFAGLTATAFALEKTTAQVTLFDVAPRPLWLQDDCSNRWLHPGIYDWPLPGSLEPWTALPVLNWRAGTASAVARQVRTEWERIAATKQRFHPRLETRITAVTRAHDRLLLALPAGDEKADFDIVVLAVGFGLEVGGEGRVAYWNDVDGLDGVAHDATVLVSGFGDGGLADVLRLCLPSTRQDSLVELVRHVPDETRRQLIDCEQRVQADPAAADKFYGKLRVERIIQHIEETAQPLARVTLAGRGHLYGPRSAVLNRFLISQLRQARGTPRFELVNSAVDEASLTKLPGGRSRIKFHDGGAAREFDHIVLRLGPKAAYRCISPLIDNKVAEERRKHWYEMPQSLDRTRVPLWEEPDAHAEDEGRRENFLAPESSSRRWCLVLRPPNPTINWDVHAKHALEKASKSIGGMNVEPFVLSSESAIVDKAAIRAAVRALCAADIVIADVTGYDPSLLMLLGIRAAVRRGVTIACTKQELSPALWKDLPFNLRELNLVSFHNQVDGHKILLESLLAGLTQSGASVRYLDLPVYDYVREDRADDTRVNPQRVLLLRAFESYGGDREIHVHNRIREGLLLPEEALVESVIDQRSPRLAGQRLYEAIRHWKICVVDLTWWRPNVMFELGVRLAVQPSETFCLIDTTVENHATFEGSRASLGEFLHPFSYDLFTSKFSFMIYRDHKSIYETAAHHFRTAQDHYSEQVDVMLVAAAAVAPGYDDPLQAVDITPLYARDNRAYGDEVRHSVFERLCAAWYYLADREEPHTLRTLDLLDRRRADVFRRFRRLGSRLKAVLAQRCEPRDQRLRLRIEQTEQYARASGATAMADLLDNWLTLRGDPAWRSGGATVRETDLDEQVEDYKELIAGLAALEDRLEALDNPVCALPLQGVRSDRRRLEIVLQTLGG
jgi:hypothetical protein